MPREQSLMSVIICNLYCSTARGRPPMRFHFSLLPIASVQLLAYLLILSQLLWGKFHKNFTLLAQAVPGPIQPL